mmetsp:Transcript_572/g.2223  ORF Transcript_572/g.2223 Transcript_572/m.2223 type:complete len:411 (-) Transcript_572:77-1309(-)
MLVGHVVLFARKRPARELVVPVALGVLLPGVEPVEVSLALGRELLTKVKVVHHVRHVHALRVERVRLGRRRDPEVSGDLLDQDEAGDGAPGAVDLLHRLRLHRLTDRQLGVPVVRSLPRGQELLGEGGDGLDGSIAVVGGVVVVVAAVQGVVGFGVHSHGRVPLDVLIPAQSLVLGAVNLGDDDAVGVIFGVLGVDLERGCFPDGVQTPGPRAPRRVEVDEEHRGLLLLVFEGPGVELEDSLGVPVAVGHGGFAFGVFLDGLDGDGGGGLVGVLGLLPVLVPAFPLDGPERVQLRVDRALEHRLGQVESVQSHRVADVDGGELARQRGERDVEVDAHHLAVRAAIDDHPRVELGREVAAHLAHQQQADDERGEHRDHAARDGALRHVLRDLAVEVHILELGLGHETHGDP